IGIILLVAGVVVVPAAIGATFGVSQGIRFVTGTVGHVEAVMASVGKPEDQELRARVGRGAWLKLRDGIVEHRDLRRGQGPDGPAGSPPSPVPDTPDSGAPSPDAAPSSQTSSQD